VDSQVVEKKEERTGGSTEPKAVLSLLRKMPIFNYLDFKQMRPPC